MRLPSKLYVKSNKELGKSKIVIFKAFANTSVNTFGQFNMPINNFVSFNKLFKMN